MNHHMSDMERYKALARQSTAESCVLLENKNNALPLEKGEKLQYTDAVHLHPKVGLSDVFGIQIDKPGTYNSLFVLKLD